MRYSLNNVLTYKFGTKSIHSYIKNNEIITDLNILLFRTYNLLGYAFEKHKQRMWVRRPLKGKHVIYSYVYT